MLFQKDPRGKDFRGVIGQDRNNCLATDRPGIEIGNDFMDGTTCLLVPGRNRPGGDLAWRVVKAGRVVE